MISITKLYCDRSTWGDTLRYNRPHTEKKPIVVWNSTRRCNLKCVHCYSQSCNENYRGELTTDEAKAMIQDLAAFKAPVLLFSGGEPLMRADMYELGAYARDLGIRPVISTNGTLISREAAAKIKEIGFGYVGISLDGVGETNDRFRGVKGAFNAALKGFENCLSIDQKVGLRLTLTKDNVQDLPLIFDLIEQVGIPRACFYHLVYTGRGADIVKDDLTPEQTRAAFDLILDRTMDMHRRGLEKDILMVDNHCDGVYLYMRLLKEDPKRAEEVYKLLLANGGNSTGIAIGCVDNLGNVHADQFWQSKSFGNVRQRPFSEIWMDTTDPIMAGLKDRKALLKGRCAQTNCKWIDICNGNFRARAVAVYDDPWMQDPACYLTDEEIARQ
ncbi:MAG: radical SAM protein [Armatimonadota bacterium]|jgi:radical SAM protein with 4Fe4S-binding SPASM domain